MSVRFITTPPNILCSDVVVCLCTEYGAALVEVERGVLTKVELRKPGATLPALQYHVWFLPSLAFLCFSALRIHSTTDQSAMFSFRHNEQQRQWLMTGCWSQIQKHVLKHLASVWFGVEIGSELAGGLVPLPLSSDLVTAAQCIRYAGKPPGTTACATVELHGRSVATASLIPIQNCTCRYVDMNECAEEAGAIE